MATQTTTAVVADIHKVDFKVKGMAPLMYGRPVHEERRDNETHAQLDERTWQQRCHTNEQGELLIPATSIHRSLVWSGKWLSLKLTGKKTYTARFQSGVICLEPYFAVTRNGKPAVLDDVEKSPLYVPSNGQRGGSTRVWRIFPVLPPPWELAGSLLVSDEAISPDIFEKHLRCSGLHDGIGSMRIGSGGPNGMFSVMSVEFSEYLI